MNSVDPDQTAPMSSLIWIHTVCFYAYISQLCLAIICRRRLQQMTFQMHFFVNTFRANFFFWKILHAFCPLLIYFKFNFFKNILQEIIDVSNSLDPDQAQHFVMPDLGPNCLQRLFADNKTGHQS